MGDESKGQPPSGYRFHELQSRETPTPEKTPEQAKGAPEQALGRFSELSLQARMDRQVKQAEKTIPQVTQEAFGKAKEAKAAPMRTDAASLDQLIAKPLQGHHGQQRPGGPSPAPGGSLWSHAPGARSQTQRPNAPGGDSPGGDGKKLEFFADRNPGHDKTPSPTR